MNYYAEEKIRELERELAGRTLRDPQPARNGPLLGPALRVFGRTLSRLGEGLESWATPAAEESEAHLRLDERT